MSGKPIFIFISKQSPTIRGRCDSSLRSYTSINRAYNHAISKLFPALILIFRIMIFFISATLYTYSV
ncbi:hypothetical protein CVE30_28980 [Pseudomonas syringae pv. actinidiae]|nr:hypothetical protein [Pseudomonas syringae pv. actinidiae]